MLKTSRPSSSTLESYRQGTCLSIMACMLTQPIFFPMTPLALQQYTIGPWLFRSSMKLWWKYNLTRTSANACHNFDHQVDEQILSKLHARHLSGRKNCIDYMGKCTIHTTSESMYTKAPERELAIWTFFGLQIHYHN